MTQSTMRTLSATSLGALFVAGACATWYFTLPLDAAGYEKEGGGMMVGCIGLPTLLAAMALGAAACIGVAINASRQSQRDWRSAAIATVLCGVLGPILVFAGQVGAQLFLPPEAVVNSPAVERILSLLIFVLPAGMPVVGLAYAAKMPSLALPPTVTP